MALTLTATITETQTAFRVTGIVPGTVDIGYLFRLGDELLEVRSFGRKDISILNGHATQNVRDMNAWIVSRHLEDTAAAGHDAGTAVLGSADAWVAGTSDAPPEPWAGPGGGSGPALSDATPEADEGAGSPGTSPDAARALHVHPGLEVTDDDTVDVLASEIEFVFEPQSPGFRRVKVRVAYADLVSDGVDMDGVWCLPLYHLGPDELLVGGHVVVVEAFDDTALNGQPRVKDALSTVVLIDTDQTMDAADPFTDGISLGKTTDRVALAGPAGGDLLLSTSVSVNPTPDGTTGILDVNLVIAAAVAPTPWSAP